MNKARKTCFEHSGSAHKQIFMKKLFVTVGLAAIGATSLHAQYAPGVSTSGSKDWSVGATLRGFYDDNYLTLPKGLAISSYGVEVSPSLSFSHSEDQTSYNVSYIYDLRWYDKTSTDDSAHQLNLGLHQSFSERYSLAVSDTLIIAQQPTVLEPTIISTPLRVQGNNVHNTGTLSGTGELTQELDLKLTYVNNYYAYSQKAGDVYNPTGSPWNPSYSALLDRIEQLASVDLDWKIQPDLTGILGYQYGHTGYTSSEGIVFAGLTPAEKALAYSKQRNNDSDFVYLGADKDFNSDLHGSVRVGAEYVDYYKAPNKTDSATPYVDASLTYQYAQGSTAQAGIKHLYNATDVVGNAAAATLDEQSTACYANVTHRMGDLTVSGLGQFQYSTFNGGSVSGQNEDFIIVGLNMAYRFTEMLSGEAGYNWNKLVSDLSGRDYTRNQIYIGVRATY